MEKVEKKFVLGDSSLNSYGFRLLTSGFMIDEFNKNPIGYYMHDRLGGVVLRWDNVQIEDDKITGVPVINTSNERGKKTLDEVNNKFLNAASFGSIVAIETSDEPALKLPGQTGATVTKWYARECSLVDIPGNFSAFALFNAKGEAIDLKFMSGTKNLNAAQKDNVINENLSVGDMLKKSVLTKDITSEQAAQLKKVYEHCPKELALILKDFTQMRVNYLMSVDYEELDKSDLMAELKEKYLQGYQQKYYQQFGKQHASFSQDDTFNKKNDKAITDAKKVYHDASVVIPVFSKQIENLIQFAIDNKDLSPQDAVLMKHINRDHPERIKDLVSKLPKQRIDTLMQESWEDLDKNDLLEELKTKYLEGFKMKYKNHFGIEYMN